MSPTRPDNPEVDPDAGTFKAAANCCERGSLLAVMCLEYVEICL
jgi:hypothetical protein